MFVLFFSVANFITTLPDVFPFLRTTFLTYSEVHWLILLTIKKNLWIKTKKEGQIRKRVIWCIQINVYMETAYLSRCTNLYGYKLLLVIRCSNMSRLEFYFWILRCLNFTIFIDVENRPCFIVIILLVRFLSSLIINISFLTGR